MLLPDYQKIVVCPGRAVRQNEEIYYLCHQNIELPVNFDD